MFFPDTMSTKWTDKVNINWCIRNPTNAPMENRGCINDKTLYPELIVTNERKTLTHKVLPYVP